MWLRKVFVGEKEKGECEFYCKKGKSQKRLRNALVISNYFNYVFMFVQNLNLFPTLY